MYKRQIGNRTFKHFLVFLDAQYQEPKTLLVQSTRSIYDALSYLFYERLRDESQNN